MALAPHGYQWVRRVHALAIPLSVTVGTFVSRACAFRPGGRIRGSADPLNICRRRYPSVLQPHHVHGVLADGQPHTQPWTLTSSVVHPRARAAGLNIAFD